MNFASWVLNRLQNWGHGEAEGQSSPNSQGPEDQNPIEENLRGRHSDDFGSYFYGQVSYVDSVDNLEEEEL